MLPLLGEVTSIDMPATAETAAIDPHYRAERRAAALAALLDAMLPGPSVIVIEDADWLDEASTEVLTHLVAAAEDRPWLVLVTRRDEPAGFRPSTGAVLELAPMSKTESRALAHVATAGRTPVAPRDRRHHRAGGWKPALSQRASPSRSGHRLRRRAARLPRWGDERRARPSPSRLLAASCAPRPSSVEAFARRSWPIFSRPMGSFSMRRSARTSTRSSSGKGRTAITFRHAMLRDVAYEGLPYRRRRELHLRAAAAIERAAQPHPEVVADALAFHFALGRRPPADLDVRAAWRETVPRTRTQMSRQSPTTNKR